MKIRGKTSDFLIMSALMLIVLISGISALDKNSELDKGHVIVMLLIIIFDVILIVLSIRLAKKSKKENKIGNGLVIIGIVIFALGELSVILDHLNLIHFSSFFEHLIMLISLILISVGFYNSQKGK